MVGGFCLHLPAIQKEKSTEDPGEMSMTIRAILMTIMWMDFVMQIYGAHITEIIVDEEPMPAGFGGDGSSGSGNGASSNGGGVYIISGSSNNFAARTTTNGNGAPTTTAAVNNNNLQNGAPFGMMPQQLCTIEIPVVKKFAGHCVRLGKKGKGCVAGEHIIPYHLDCL